MGSDKNYLCIEPAANADPDDVESRLMASDTFDAWSKQYNGTVIVAGYGGSQETALQQLKGVQDDVHRALLLHIYDTAMSGIGWVYERTTDGLVEREEVPGAEQYGIDVVDYVKREYDIDGPR